MAGRQVIVENWPVQRPKPYDRNPRNNKRAVAKVAASIRKFGFRQPIVVDTEGVIVTGHTRLRAAQRLKLAEVPVVIVNDLSPEQIKAYRIADNRVGEEATWDKDLLALELADLKLADFDMKLTGFDSKELRALDEIAPSQDSDCSSPDQFSELSIYRPALNTKRTVRFLSVRRWRDELKDIGIREMKALKQLCSPDVLTSIALELNDVLMPLLGGIRQFTIAAPPSSKSRVHFATELGRRLGELTRAPFAELFEDRPRQKSSHPRHYAERGEMKLIADVPERVLLVDDIATSGTTIEQCIGALRQSRPGAMILPIVWIYEAAGEVQ